MHCAASALTAYIHEQTVPLSTNRPWRYDTPQAIVTVSCERSIAHTLNVRLSRSQYMLNDER